MGGGGGLLLEGGRLIEGALIKLFFVIVEVTGPRRLENGLVVPGRITAFTKSAAIGQKLKGTDDKHKRTLQIHRDGNNYK